MGMGILSIRYTVYGIRFTVAYAGRTNNNLAFWAFGLSAFRAKRGEEGGVWR